MSMEDVDKILLQQLRDLGWSSNDEKSKLKELDAGEMLSCVLTCVKSIQATATTDSDLDRSLNAISYHESLNMSTKYKLAQLLADYCVRLGYKGKIGYQTFLYGSEQELRKLLLFLLERVSAHEPIQEVLPSNLPSNLLLSKIHSIKIVPWKPPKPVSRREQLTSSRQQVNWREVMVPVPALNAKSIITGKIAPNKRTYFDKYASMVTDISQLLELNALETMPDMDSLATIVKSRKLELDSSSTELSVDRLEIASPLAASSSLALRQVSRVESRIRRLKMSRGDDSVKTDGLVIEKVELQKSISKLGTRIEEERKLAVNRQVLSLTMEDLDSVRDKLLAEIAAIHEKWTELKEELNEEMTQLEANNSGALEVERERQYLMEQITEKTSQISAKEDHLASLESKINAIKEWPPNRSSYTKRILEIIANIKKQEGETTNLLAEMKTIQKDINDLVGKVSRSFTLVEETIFKDAKSGTDFHRKCYKLLASLHTHWDSLLEDLDEISRILRESHSLDESMETEKSQESERNLARIKADFDHMHSENVQLESQLKSEK